MTYDQVNYVRNRFKFNISYKSYHIINLKSLNYGTIPTSLETPPVFWIQVKASHKIKLNDVIRVIGLKDKYKVDDIIGVRIILSPLSSKDYNNISPYIKYGSSYLL